MTKENLPLEDLLEEKSSKVVLPFDRPWAEDGIREEAPMVAQVDGSASFQQGYTPYYALEPEEGGKYIRYEIFNDILYKISKGIIDVNEELKTVVAGGLTTDDIVQETGTQTDKIMSQKAVTDELGLKVNKTTTINGKALNTNVTITTQDTYKTAISLGSTNLNSVITPGLYWQNVDANTSLTLNYPLQGTGSAGSLEVIPTGVGGVSIQRYSTYLGQKTFTRGYFSGSWTAWQEQYSTFNLPNLEATNIGKIYLPAKTFTKIEDYLNLKIGEVVFLDVGNSVLTPPVLTPPGTPVVGYITGVAHGDGALNQVTFFLTERSPELPKWLYIGTTGNQNPAKTIYWKQVQLV